MKYLLAYSGGLDSEVLLRLFSDKLQHEKNISLRAVHVHHGLLANADQWVAHCQQSCSTLGIPLEILYVNAKPRPGESPEAAAREARYKALAAVLTKDEILLTAHHQQDQAETLLLQLFRGAGLAGLAAMPELKRFGIGWQWRPLLAWSREKIRAYAQEHRLNWVEDESNIDIRFDRNFVRHRLMPLLVQRWPQAAANIARSASHLADAMYLLNENILPPETPLSQILKVNFRQQIAWFRNCLLAQNLPMMSTKKTQQVLQDFLYAAQDRHPQVLWHDQIIYRYNDHLCFRSSVKIDYQYLDILWPSSLDTLLLPDHRQLQMQFCRHNGLRLLNAEERATLHVRFRRGGERFHPANRTHSQSLKKLLQEWQVPTWQREALPLLYIGEELIAVADIAVAKAYAMEEGEQGWRVLLRA